MLEALPKRRLALAVDRDRLALFRRPPSAGSCILARHGGHSVQMTSLRARILLRITLAILLVELVMLAVSVGFRYYELRVMGYTRVTPGSMEPPPGAVVGGNDTGLLQHGEGPVQRREGDQRLEVAVELLRRLRPLRVGEGTNHGAASLGVPDPVGAELRLHLPIDAARCHFGPPRGIVMPLMIMILILDSLLRSHKP